MADQNPPSQTSVLKIPAETAQKFAHIIELIKGSESMNDEERQYWINILPAMTADQIKSLEDILVSERQQLSAIDAKYNQQQAAQGRPVDELENERRQRREQHTSQEKAREAEERNEEDQILKQINTL